jgi:hypothetical protein
MLGARGPEDNQLISVSVVVRPWFPWSAVLGHGQKWSENSMGTQKEMFFHIVTPTCWFVLINMCFESATSTYQLLDFCLSLRAQLLELLRQQSFRQEILRYSWAPGWLA